MNKPQTLSGFRDFLPDQKRKRDWMTGKIIEVFERFGFEPLETPTLESASLLLGKYGAEADKLVYSFKDNGDRDVGLRYDQTVPTARVLAQYENELPKYFRRYQIQNVFRAERPQKGRFREFAQCDIDIFGSTNPLSDAEILACTYFSFLNAGFKKVILKLNDRATLLSNLEKFATESVTVFSIIQSIDKLDKISEANVAEELKKKGLTEETTNGVLGIIKNAQCSSQLSYIIALAVKLGVPKSALVFTPALARGLDYYTGMIFEVSVPEYGTSSLGGGGRYDKLIEQLGGNSTPAVGIAFGFDRMIEAAELLKLFTLKNLGTQALVTVFNPSLLDRSLEVVNSLREAGIASEFYIEPGDKLEKQLKYADRKGIPYVVIQGPDEAARDVVKLKTLATKEQEEIRVEEVITKLKGN